jgi:Mg2+/citrate symporter
MNKLPLAVYGFILSVVVAMMVVFTCIVLSVTDSYVWGLLPLLLSIAVWCFIVYRLQIKKVSNNKTKDEKDNK